MSKCRQNNTKVILLVNDGNTNLRKANIYKERKGKK